MKQITPQEFLNKVESHIIKEVFSVGRRVYGTDYTYDLNVWASGKDCQEVWADIP